MSKGEQVIADFWDVLNKMAWLNKFKMKEILKDYKPSEIHCLDYIGSNKNSNVTKLAEAFRMTTGGITKITKKLITKGLIESYKKPENKKEIYFKLTEQGNSVYNIHNKLHKEFQDRDKAVFEQISDEIFDNMLNFAKIYSKHLDNEIKKLNLNVKSDFCDKL